MVMDMSPELMVPSVEMTRGMLHIGVHKNTTLERLAQVAGCLVNLLSSDGDDWQEWGEKPTTDVRHTIVRLGFGASPDAVNEWVQKWWAAGLLWHGYSQTVSSYIAVMTSGWDSWEEDVLIWRAPCEVCRRFVMNELMCPNAREMCVDCCGEGDH